MLKMGNQAMYQAQRLLNLRTYDYAALVGKFVSTVMLPLALFFQILGITAVIVIVFVVFAVQRIQFGSEVTMVDAFNQVVSNGWYQIFLIFIIIISIRRIMFRLSDEEV